jgi:hypothetical protein
MCTLVQALRLRTGCMAQSRSRVIALLLHDHGTRRGWGVRVTPRPFFTPGKDPVPIVQEAGWAPGPVWTDAENLAPTGMRSPDRPSHSQPMYRLGYPVLLRRGLNEKESFVRKQHYFERNLAVNFATSVRHIQRWAHMEKFCFKWGWTNPVFNRRKIVILVLRPI